MSDYIWHISLDSGDMARSARSEVSDTVVDQLGRHLKAAIDKGRDIIPTTACTLMASHAGPHLVGTILDMTGRPILTFGVAPRARGANKLWTMLVEGRRFDAEPGDAPEAPWIAARMEPGASAATLAPWMADYERCIAWAWIDKRAE